MATGPVHGLFALVVAPAPDKVLKVALRKKIWEHVQRYPGLHMREVARAVDVQPNHAKYHLERLERAGLVSSRREDGYWRFWPKEEGSVGMRDQVSREEKRMLSVLRRPVPLHVALIMLDQGQVTPVDLLQEVDVSRSTLYYHMDRMQRAEIIDSRRDGQARAYWIRDPVAVARLLRRYKPMPRLMERFVDAWNELPAGDPLHDSSGPEPGDDPPDGRESVLDAGDMEPRRDPRHSAGRESEDDVPAAEAEAAIDAVSRRDG